MARSRVIRRGKGLLKTVPASVRGELQGAVRKGAAQIVAVQKTLAPVDDGDLRDSITYRMGDEADVPYASLKSAGGVRSGDEDLVAVVSAGNTKVRYAHLVEFGTAPHPQGGLFEGATPAVMHPGTPPRGFFLPGYRIAKKVVKAQIRKAVRDGATKVVQKG